MATPSINKDSQDDSDKYIEVSNAFHLVGDFEDLTEESRSKLVHLKIVHPVHGGYEKKEEKKNPEKNQIQKEEQTGQVRVCHL